MDELPVMHSTPTQMAEACLTILIIVGEAGRDALMKWALDHVEKEPRAHDLMTVINDFERAVKHRNRQGGDHAVP